MLYEFIPQYQKLNEPEKKLFEKMWFELTTRGIITKFDDELVKEYHYKSKKTLQTHLKNIEKAGLIERQTEKIHDAISKKWKVKARQIFLDQNIFPEFRPDINEPGALTISKKISLMQQQIINVKKMYDELLPTMIEISNIKDVNNNER